MRSSDSEKLLNDIIGENGYRRFHHDLLKEAAVEFRRAHPIRFREWLLPLAAAVAAVATTLIFFAAHGKMTIQTIIEKPVEKRVFSFVVSSMPLRSDQVFASTAPSAVISTEPLDNDLFVRSSPSKGALVQTPPNAAVATVNDSELLALFPSEPTLLATIGGRKTFLIIKSP
jgi:hypothetical protein